MKETIGRDAFSDQYSKYITKFMHVIVVHNDAFGVIKCSC